MKYQMQIHTNFEQLLETVVKFLAYDKEDYHCDLHCCVSSSHITKLSFVFAVAPLAIVVLCIGLYLDKYGLNEQCWLTYNDYIIMAMLGPVLFCIFVSS